MSNTCNDPIVELTDVYDSNRRRTGEIIPRSEWREGKYRLVVQMCIFSDDRMLIQKRSMGKRSFPGLWDTSAAGQVDAGEESHEGARREIFEELGLEYDLSESDLYLSIRLPRVFNDVYLLEYNGGDITIQRSEVDSYAWATEDEIIGMIGTGEFIRYKPELIRSFFDAYRKGIRNAPELVLDTTYI